MNPLRWILLLLVVPWLLAASPAAAFFALATPFTIHWTATGDDGMAGRATAYDLRYSILPLTEANFALATRITGLPLPAMAGWQESFVVSGIQDSVACYLGLKTADETGSWSALSNVIARPAVTTGVGEAAVSLSFSPPSPNPARQTVRWTYSLPQRVQVRVDVFDSQGRHVRTLASGDREAGAGELVWNLRDDGGRPSGPGIYFVKARMGSNEWTKRLIVVR